jgi:hypothetical protein
MVDQATAQYLNENIGGVLSQALAEMSTAQPVDAVDFLSRWLKVYAEQEEAKAYREKEEALLAQERAATQQQLAKKETERQERVAAKQKLDNMYAALQDKFNCEKTLFADGFWQELVDVTYATAGAEAVYLGRKDEGLDGIEGEVLQYDATSDNSSWVEEALESKTVSMKDKLLGKGVGVTWGALEDTPEAGFPEESFRPDGKDVPEDAVAKFLWKPPSEVEAAKARAAAEALPNPPDPLPEVVRLPQYPVSIDCVTDNPSVNYFNMTRLGAYLAVPLVYKSYYTEKALNEAKDFLKARREEANQALAKFEEAKKEAAANGEPVPEEPAVDPTEEKKVMELTPELKRRALCLDTLGTNRKIDSAQIPKLLELCKACGGCKSRTEMDLLKKQAEEQIDDDARDAEQKAIDEVSAEISQHVSDSMKDELAKAEESEEAKNVAEKKRDYISACKLALKCKDKISSMKTWVWVDEKVKEVIAAIIFMYGGTRDVVYPKRKTTLDWPTLLQSINDALFEAIAKTESGATFIGKRTGLKEEHKLKFISDLALRAGAPFGDGVDVEKAKTICPAFGVLFGLIEAACNLRKADIAERKAAYLKRKQEAEDANTNLEEGQSPQEFAETPPWDGDDDMEE